MNQKSCTSKQVEARVRLKQGWNQWRGRGEKLQHSKTIREKDKNNQRVGRKEMREEDTIFRSLLRIRMPSFPLWAWRRKVFVSTALLNFEKVLLCVATYLRITPNI